MKQKAQGIPEVFPSIFVKYGGKRSSKMNAEEFLKKLNESRKPEEAYSVKGQHGMPVEFFTVYDVQEKKKISLIEYYKNSPFFWRNESLHACFTPEKIIGIEKIDGSETQIELIDLKHYNKICDLVEIVNEFEKMYYLYPQFKKMDLNERNAILLKILSHKKKDERMKILEEFHRHYDNFH